MKYTQYTIKTTTEDADLVSVLLMDVGICDLQIENNVQLTDEELNQMYADFKKELPEDDGSCDVIFYREEKTPEDAETFQKDLRKLLADAPDIIGIDAVSLEISPRLASAWEMIPGGAPVAELPWRISMMTREVMTTVDMNLGR